MNINIIIDTESNDVIPVNKVIDRKTDPILWCRNGEYRIVPREVVENAVDNLEMFDRLSTKNTFPKIKIMWNQGIPISNQAGRALIGE